MAGPNVQPMQVLHQLMDDGLFDTLRKSITAELENNIDLRRFTTEEVEKSQVLQAPGAERRSRRELFEALRRELQTKVLERASEAAWNAILSKDGVGLRIEEQVEKTWWELNGWGTPPKRIRPSEEKPAAGHPAIEVQSTLIAPSIKPGTSNGVAALKDSGSGGVAVVAEKPSQKGEAAASKAIVSAAPPRLDGSPAVPEEVHYVPLNLDVEQATEEAFDGNAPPGRDGVSGPEIHVAETIEAIEQTRPALDAQPEPIQDRVEATAVGPASAEVEAPSEIVNDGVSAAGGQAGGGAELPSQAQEAAAQNDGQASMSLVKPEILGTPARVEPGAAVVGSSDALKEETKEGIDDKVDREQGGIDGEPLQAQPASLGITAQQVEAEEARGPGGSLEGDRDPSAQVNPNAGPEAGRDSILGVATPAEFDLPKAEGASGGPIPSSPIEVDNEMTEATPAGESDHVTGNQVQAGDRGSGQVLEAVIPTAEEKGDGQLDEGTGEKAVEGHNAEGAKVAAGQVHNMAGPATKGGDESKLDAEARNVAPVALIEISGQVVAETGGVVMEALVSEHVITPQAMEEG